MSIISSQDKKVLNIRILFQWIFMFMDNVSVFMGIYYKYRMDKYPGLKNLKGEHPSCFS